MPALAGVVYVLFLLFVVLRLLRAGSGDLVDYVVAGRRLTLPAFTASLVTTWYGGILGVGEYTWSHGVSNWLVFGVPYYLYAGIFALFLAGRARRSRVLTVPELLERRFGRGPALIGAVMLFVMTAPGAYVLMLGVLVGFATGWPLWVGVVLGTALSVGYVFRGGLRAVVATDLVQFVLMFVGFLILVPVCVGRFGGWSFLQANLPPSHLTWDGGLGLQAVAVWYFIAMATLVEPAFYQRCYAAKSEGTARWGIALAIVLWIVFDFLTTTAGLYARAALPDLADPVRAFPALAGEVLPPLWQGLFIVGLLATIMSTVDSYAFIGGDHPGPRRDRTLARRSRSGGDRGLRFVTADPLEPAGDGAAVGGHRPGRPVGGHDLEDPGFGRYTRAAVAAAAGPYRTRRVGAAGGRGHGRRGSGDGDLAGARPRHALVGYRGHLSRAGGFAGGVAAGVVARATAELTCGRVRATARPLRCGKVRWSPAHESCIRSPLSALPRGFPDDVRHHGSCALRRTPDPAPGAGSARVACG